MQCQVLTILMSESMMLYTIASSYKKSTALLFRSAVLTFAEGDVNMTFTVEVLEDDIPEILEAFQVTLSAPTGGAIVGDNSSILVGILTNDDAHGIIGFAPVSIH